MTATSFLDFETVSFNGHMIAVMALMEAPAIIVGVLLVNYFKSAHRKGGLYQVKGVQYFVAFSD